MAKKPSSSTISLMPLSALRPGQYADFFAKLQEKTKGTTRDSKPFYTCRFRDARRTVSFMVWADSSWYEECHTQWHEGQFYKLRATYQEHPRYGPQIELDKLRAVLEEDRKDGFDPADFVEHSRFDAQEMFRQLMQLVEVEIQNKPLRMLVQSLLEQHAQTLQRLPASPRHYFPFAGGWLEHTLSATRTCVLLVDRYRDYYTELQPALNRDLLLAAAVLHDLGRVAELEPWEPYELTVAGRLFGHIQLCRDLIQNAANQQGDLDPQLRELLEHLILTQLPPLDGPTRQPVIPEGLILQHAVELDAKLEMVVRSLSRATSEGPFTERDPLLGRALLRERKQ